VNIRSKPPSTFTSREFNQDIARAKRAAKDGPVFITSRGEPTHVLMTFEEYEIIKDQETADTSLREALIDPEHGDDVELPIPQRRVEDSRRVDLG
jgi:prevent-host-death family protein